MDKQYYVSRDWAIASDGLQWIVQKKKGNQWRSKFFIRSSRDILERCMREAGAPKEDIHNFAQIVPQTFSEWWATQVPINENNRCHTA